jgi:UPF0271 protein
MSGSESAGTEVPGSVARWIDLNADLGEGFPNDADLLRIVSSVSICCGAHAGDLDTIRRTMRTAVVEGVVVGAHPGYPDPEGFGRRPMFLDRELLLHLILVQVEFLESIALEFGVRVRFLKPHGALYNRAQAEELECWSVVEAARKLGLPLLGRPGTPLAGMAADLGVRLVPEGFPDRRARADGSLVPRSEEGAVLHDPLEIETQVVRLVEGGRVATLCIHGDEPTAVANAERVRSVLRRRGIAIRSFLA